MHWMMMAALALTATAVPDADMQFDLDCSGTGTVYKHGVTRSERFHQRLRLDLLSRRFCVDECAKIEPIISVDADRIVLADEDRKVAFWTFTDLRRFDRRSGRLTIEQADLVKLESRKAEAVCRIRHFTPFPKKS